MPKSVKGLSLSRQAGLENFRPFFLKSGDLKRIQSIDGKYLFHCLQVCSGRARLIYLLIYLFILIRANFSSVISSDFKYLPLMQWWLKYLSVSHQDSLSLFFFFPSFFFVCVCVCVCVCLWLLWHIFYIHVEPSGLKSAQLTSPITDWDNFQKQTEKEGKKKT